MPEIIVEPANAACGAKIIGVDISKPLTPEIVSDIRSAWFKHHVLVFPEQDLRDGDLERFTLYFGPFGDDPFIAPIVGRANVIAVSRRADEHRPVFAESWHTDWSFLPNPPAGTCLYGVKVPQKGGDTLFANQHLALETMPEALRNKISELRSIHSAQIAYSPEGLYGETDKSTRSMDIRPSNAAHKTFAHNTIKEHSETGRAAVFGCAGYVLGFEDTPPEVSGAILGELYQWQTQEKIQYRHKWTQGDVVMWDNRSVLHRATGGYEGHERLLHRTTIAER